MAYGYCYLALALSFDGVTFFFLTVLFFRSDTHSRMLDTWVRRSPALQGLRN